MGKEDKGFEKAMQSLEDGIKCIEDAVKEIERAKIARLSLTAYYREGKDLKKAERVVRKITRVRKKLDKELSKR